METDLKYINVPLTKADIATLCRLINWAIEGCTEDEHADYCSHLCRILECMSEAIL